ncbi:MAG TPA: YdcF family protein [Candidatus Sulfotelmatobacter sp.]
MRKGNLLWAAAALAGLVSLAAGAGYWLVVDAPQPSDAIVVLAGETDRRPLRALDLFGQNYGRRILLDVPAEARTFGSTDLELAQKYIQRLPQAASITICPIAGLSTRDESHDVARCLQGIASDRVLLVTSDFHTRRALSIFRHESPDKRFSVAAARDRAQFGERWWMHRQWAKICAAEWLRMLWWQTVDRWR